MNPAQTPASAEDAPWTWREAAMLAAALGVAAALRAWNLDAQFWLDELSALGSIRRPLGDILTQWPGASSHIFFEALAHVGDEFAGAAAWGARLPAVAFGVAGVAAVYALARMLSGRPVALFVAALLATSYHHVFFSQNARGYTMLMFFFVVATLLFLRMVGRERLGGRIAAGYILATALGAYSNLFGIFVLAGHAVVAAGLWLLRERPGTPRIALRDFALTVIAAGALILLLYAPFVASILAYTQRNVADPGEGPRAGVGLVVEVVEGLRAAFGGWPGLLALTAFGLAGAWYWVRRFPLALALLAAPLVLQGAALVVLGAGIHPRYFANALPVMLLVAGTCLAEAVRWVGSRVGAAGAIGVPLALGVVVAASAAPLQRYYKYPKQDYLGAVRAVDARAQAQDGRVGVHLAGHVLHGYYGLPFEQAESLADLASLEKRYPRLWLVTTLERLMAVQDAALARHIHERYRRVDVFPGTVGDGDVRLYVGPQ